MKPDPSAFTSFCSLIGSPAMNGERTIEPVMSLTASARPARLMKLPAEALGQVCHCRSSALTDCPRPISDFGSRISTVGSCATGAAGASVLSDPLASQAAMPPAPIAMVNTTMRAVFIRFTFHITPRRCRRRDGS